MFFIAALATGALSWGAQCKPIHIGLPKQLPAFRAVGVVLVVTTLANIYPIGRIGSKLAPRHTVATDSANKGLFVQTIRTEWFPAKIHQRRLRIFPATDGTHRNTDIRHKSFLPP